MLELYKWGVKRSMNVAVKLVEALHAKEILVDELVDAPLLAKRSLDFFRKRILRDLKAEDEAVRRELERQPRYTQESVRALFASDPAFDEEVPSDPLLEGAQFPRRSCFVFPRKDEQWPSYDEMVDEAD